MTELVRISQLNHVYPDGTSVHLNTEQTLSVQKGEKLAILGANGSGKTTLLAAMMGLIKPVESQIEVCGLSPNRDFQELRKKIGVVLQNVEEQLIGPMVFDDIAFSLRQDGVAMGKVNQEVVEIATILGIGNKLEKIPHYLSGGEQQKVALAGALVHRPDILILDEPLDAINAESRHDVEQLLNKLSQEQNVTIILTTHDVNWVSTWADTICILGQGEVICHGAPEQVMTNQEAIEKAGLEPPVLVSLFQQLEKNSTSWSASTPLPVTIEQAIQFLTKPTVDDKV